MEYRILPRTGWKISAISFGCMSLSRELGAGSKEQGAGSREQGAESRELSSERLLHRALDLGINYFDTADLYDQGENEIIVGRALRTSRSEVYIATKVGNQMRPDGSGWDWNPRKEYILKAVEGSLKRLQTDYIDLYQLHGGTIEDPIDETIEAFELLKEQGKIREYGISSIRPNVIREYVARSNIVSVMMQYSLLDRRPEESCLPFLEQNGIGVMVRGAVAKGLLAGKSVEAYLGYTEEKVRKVIERLRGAGYGVRDSGFGVQGAGSGVQGAGFGVRGVRTLAQTALQFALRGPAICAVVAGMRTEKQLLENVGAVEAPQINEKEYQDLRSVLEPKFYEAHR